MKTRKLKAYLRPSLTTFCRNLFERTEEKRRRIRADDSFQFSAQRYLEDISFQHIQGQWVQKILARKVLAAKRKSLVLTRTRQRKQTASCSGHQRRRSPFFLILNSSTPIQLRFKELCGGFHTTLRSPSKRISVKRSVTVFHRSRFFRCKLNIRSISRCTFQIIHGDVKIVQNERKRRIVIDRDGRLTLKLCLLTMPSFEFNFHSCARSILPRPRANIPQNGPRARLVSV